MQYQIGHRVLKYLNVVFCCFILVWHVAAQTTQADGNWSSNSTWSGGSIPSAGAWTTININHTLEKSTGWNVRNRMYINNGASMTFNDDLTVDGGSYLHIYGELVVNGSINLTGYMMIYPGAKVVVENNVTVYSSPYLTIGTNEDPLPYADLVVKGNLNSVGSGDITVERNGRVAIYGDVTADGGGTFLTIENGGQIFVNGDIHFVGGGNQINNKNTEEGYYGLYISENSSVTFEGGGSGFAGGQGAGTQTGSNSGYSYVENMPGENNPFLEWLQRQPDTPVDPTLPVSLVFVEARTKLDQVMLTWQTATEINNDYFTIEKSKDGVAFESVGKVSGGGNAEHKITYRWDDPKPLSSLAYYRLSQTDYDGTTKILALEAVIPETFPVSVSFYPNPAFSGQMLRIQGVLPERISIFDHTGKVVMSGQPVSTQIELPTLKSGLYVIQTISGEEVITSKLLVK